MHALACESLVKHYGETRALENLSFTVEPGELFGLIGPDGAGKTTFMRIAACLLLQDSGILTIMGNDTVRRPSEVKRLIGYMPQRFSLYPDLSVMENLLFFSELFGVRRRERKEKIEKLLEFSKLGPFLERRAEKLSGGMKQKLALSCTLIHTPEILFLDEPTTGVDPVSRREFWDLLFELKEEGTTIVVSTPYMDEAGRCDRVGLMMGGAFILEGRPSEITEMFEHDILEVRAENIAKSARGLAFPGIVMETHTFGDRIHLTVEDAEEAYPVLRRFLAENGMEDFVLERVQPSIEDVFMEKIGGGGNGTAHIGVTSPSAGDKSGREWET